MRQRAYWNWKKGAFAGCCRWRRIGFERRTAGLVRAGVPLHLGLNASRGGMKSRLRAVSDELSAALAAGQPLDQAVSSRSAAFPPLYAVLLESGVRGGRLSAALSRLPTCRGGCSTTVA